MLGAATACSSGMASSGTGGGISPAGGDGAAVSSAAALADAGRPDALDGGTDFVHPGILHTQAELDRMQAKVNAGAEPWLSGWEKLTANSFSQSSYTPNPQSDMCAGNCPNGENYMALARDAAAAYQNALRYRIAGTTANADEAVANVERLVDYAADIQW